MKVFEREQLPLLELPETEGGTVDLNRYRGRRNLVILFIGKDCRTCEALASELAKAYQDIIGQEGEALVIMNSPVSEASAFKKRLNLPYPVLVDETGGSFQKYGVFPEEGKTQTALFIADRFGSIYHIFENELPGVPEILSWLEFIEIQCPE